MNVNGQEIRAITVYCASSNAVPKSAMALARDCGRALAERGLTMVYGGGSIGMMGQAATAAVGAGGEVHGVITRYLKKWEVAHADLTHLDVLETMHERKQRMTDLGDAFFVLPGGFGTLDETIEAITWKQLHIHTKPIVLVNHEGYFDTLLAFFREAVERRYVHEANMELFEVAEDIPGAFEALGRTRPPRPEANPLWQTPGAAWADS